MWRWLWTVLLVPALAFAQISYGPPNPESVIDYVEEFCGSAGTGSIGILGWRFVNGSVSNTAPEANHPCIKNHSTGGTINTIAHMSWAPSNTAGVVLPESNFELTYIIRPTTNTQQEMRIGLFDDATAAPPANGIYFEHNSATDADWACVTRAASTETRTDIAGQAVTANTWYHLMIRRVSASAIEFWLNRALACTHSTNVPTAALYFGHQVENLEAVAKTIDLDYFRVRIRGLSR